MRSLFAFLLILCFLVTYLQFSHCSLISHCKKPGYIALTFDDGPSINYTENILKCLEKARVKATFHISADIISKDKRTLKLAKEIIAQGHLVGLRFDPNINDIRPLKPQAFRKALEKDKQLIKNLLGYNVKFLRLPYESYPPSAIKLAEQMGFIVTEHSLDSKDFIGDNDSIVKAYKNSITSTSSFISVHRDHAQATVQNLPTVLKMIKTANLNPVTLSACIVGHA